MCAYFRDGLRLSACAGSYRHIHLLPEASFPNSLSLCLLPAAVCLSSCCLGVVLLGRCAESDGTCLPQFSSLGQSSLVHLYADRAVSANADNLSLVRSCTRREEEFYLGIWLFTTTFYHWHEQFGRVFGECEWNPYATFYHFSGFVGYVMLAHYIRKYLDWSRSFTFKVCIPGFLITYALMVWSFLSRSHWAANPQGLEMDWQMTSTLVALNSFFVFMLFKTITYHEGNVYKVVSSFSAMSYGMYLMHMLILPHFWALFYPTSLPVGVAQVLTAICAYLTSYVVARVISIPKWGKYLIG